MPSSYRDLKVWQNAIDIAENIYRVTADFPSSEIFGLTSRMRKACVSIPSNIVEGWGRRSRKDYCRYVVIAQGSNDELQTQILIASRLKLGSQESLAAAATQAEEIGRMLSGLHTYLQIPKTSRPA